MQRIAPQLGHLLAFGRRSRRETIGVTLPEERSVDKGLILHVQ